MDKCINNNKKVKKLKSRLNLGQGPLVDKKTPTKAEIYCQKEQRSKHHDMKHLIIYQFHCSASKFVLKNTIAVQCIDQMKF